MGTAGIVRGFHAVSFHAAMIGDSVPIATRFPTECRDGYAARYVDARSPTADPDAGQRLAKVGELELCYDEWGDRSNETVLLVMGLGVQMIGWREGFCEALVERGFHVCLLYTSPSPRDRS